MPTRVAVHPRADILRMAFMVTRKTVVPMPKPHLPGRRVRFRWCLELWRYFAMTQLGARSLYFFSDDALSAVELMT